METNGRIIAEIRAETRELKASQGRHEAMIRELKASHEQMRRVQKFVLSLIQEQAKEARESKREHERWLRNHEVRLQSHYRMISGIR